MLTSFSRPMQRSQLSPVLGESPELESIVVSGACPLQYPRYKGLHIPVTIHLLIFQQKCFEEFAGPPHAWIVKTCKFQGSSHHTHQEHHLEVQLDKWDSYRMLQVFQVLYPNKWGL